MSNYRTDLQLINFLIENIGLSKINENSTANNILKKLEKIGLTTDTECKKAVLAYVKHLNSDSFSSLGRILHKILTSQSLNEGVRFSKHINDSVTISEDPLFITGLPRSGTTNLHNLIIDNYGYKGFKYWELTSPAKRYENIFFDSNLRKLRSWIGFRLYRYLIPSIQSMHNVKMDTYEECWHFHKNFFFCYNYSIQIKSKNLEDYILNTDTSFLFKFHKNLISQNSSGNIPFALKCPEHLLFLKDINSNFPKSNIVWIHRQPYDAIKSYCSMIDSVWSLFFKPYNEVDVRDYVISLFDRMLQGAIKDIRENGIKVIDVSYNSLISDRDQVVRDLSGVLSSNNRNNQIEATKAVFFKNKYNRDTLKYNLSKDKIDERFKYYTDMYSEYLQ